MKTSQKKLKLVIILGRDHNKAFDSLLKLCKSIASDEVVLIGDGVKFVSRDDITDQLTGRIDKDTKIIVGAHGSARHGKHKMTLIELGFDTSKVIELLDSLTPDPVHVVLNSCHSGAANPDIAMAKKGSTLITISEPTDVAFDINSKFIMDYLYTNKYITDTSQQFFMNNIHNFVATTSFCMSRGNSEAPYKYVVRPFQGRPVKLIATVNAFLKDVQQKFKDSYEGEVQVPESLSIPTPISEQQAQKTLHNHFLHLLLIDADTNRDSAIKFIENPDTRDFIRNFQFGSIESDMKWWNIKAEVLYAMIKHADVNVESVLSIFTNYNFRKDLFIVAVKANDLITLDKLIPAVGTNIGDMVDGFFVAINYGSTDAAKKLLPYIKDETKAISTGFKQAISAENTDLINQLIPLMEKDPKSMSEGFKQAISAGNTGLIDRLIPIMAKDPKSMSEGFKQVVSAGNTDLIDRLIPLMENDPKSMLEGFKQAVSAGNTALIDRLIPIMSPLVEKDPQSMSEEFKGACLYNKKDLIDRLIPLMAKDPKSMLEGFKQAVSARNTDLIDRLIPLMAKDPKSMLEGFEKAVFARNTDLIYQLIPLMKKDPQSMSEGFKAAVIMRNTDLIDRLIPLMEKDPQSMSEGFLYALGDIKLIDKLIPFMKNHPQSMLRGFSEACLYNNEYVITRLIPLMKKDPKSMSEGFYSAMRAGNKELADRLFFSMIEEPMSIVKAIEESYSKEIVISYVQRYQPQHIPILLQSARQLGNKEITDMLRGPAEEQSLPVATPTSFNFGSAATLGLMAARALGYGRSDAERKWRKWAEIALPKGKASLEQHQKKDMYDKINALSKDVGEKSEILVEKKLLLTEQFNDLYTKSTDREEQKRLRQEIEIINSQIDEYNHISFALVDFEKKIKQLVAKSSLPENAQEFINKKLIEAEQGINRVEDERSKDMGKSR